MKILVFTLVAFYFSRFALSQSYEISSPENIITLSFKVENGTPITGYQEGIK